MTTDIGGVAETLAIERIARVLAAWHTSTNADGISRSAGAEVDADWPDQVDTAIAILKVLREPDSGMAAIGDAAIWRHMIDAAILGRARIDLPGLNATPIRDAGIETHMHGGAWTKRDERLDETFPASDPAPVNPGVD